VAVKGRMINASHMHLAYPSILLGERIVPRPCATGGSFG
jgi:hypothetical protein